MRQNPDRTLWLGWRAFRCEGNFSFRRGDDEKLFTVWALGLFACAGLRDADSFLAVLALKRDEGRFGRDGGDVSTFRAFALLARVCILNTDLVTAVFTAKPNH